MSASINKFEWDLNQTWNLLHFYATGPGSWRNLKDKIGEKIAAAVAREETTSSVTTSMVSLPRRFFSEVILLQGTVTKPQSKASESGLMVYKNL
jgi:hypothetical protein